MKENTVDLKTAFLSDQVTASKNIPYTDYFGGKKKVLRSAVDISNNSTSTG